MGRVTATKIFIKDGLNTFIDSISAYVQYMDGNTRKPVFGVSDQVIHNPACTVTKAC